MPKSLFAKVLVLILVIIAETAPATAQYSAGFQGIISDPSGAVVPGVKVTALNTQSGIPYSATSNEAGLYHLTNLPPGTYKLSAEKEGFQKAETADLVLHTEELKGVNLTLNVGNLLQTVNVTVPAPLLNTEQAPNPQKDSCQTAVCKRGRLDRETCSRRSCWRSGAP
jgi:carboxypeptidase family protein